ncbi:MAG: NAD(P)H-dependent oxidoreductase [Clostridia bacterium]|nr:NAD(P)H-dependent oxidoreductase [Clostridia bacterium]
MSNLIIYYSRKGQNYWNGSIKELKNGNTEIVAEFIQKAVGGDLFEVETVKQYFDDYYACIEEAQKELRANARPEIKRYPENLESYDVIFLGYPNWWGTMPMAMFTLLEKCDLKGKKIIPFCTNEGSGMGNSESDLKKLCGGAEVLKGLSVHGAEAAQSEKRVADWAKAELKSIN